MNEDFDWDAYHRDTRMLSPGARGAWWDCLYQQRLSPTRGRISMPLTGYASIFGTSPGHAKRLLDEISLHEVGNIVTEDNGKITVINRRMFRQWQAKEGNKNRQAAYRGRHSANESNAKVTEAAKTPLEEEEINKEITIKHKKRRGPEAHRIPDPFPISDTMAAWAEKECPGLALLDAHDDFVEYYTNLTTAKAFKVNWLLTWQKGMKLALKWQLGRAAESSVGKHDEPDIPDPDCSECCDLKTVMVGEGMNLTEVPCPECVGVAA